MASRSTRLAFGEGTGPPDRGFRHTETALPEVESLPEPLHHLHPRAGGLRHKMADAAGVVGLVARGVLNLDCRHTDVAHESPPDQRDWTLASARSRTRANTGSARSIMASLAVIEARTSPGR